jgi:hypothetical protein
VWDKVVTGAIAGIKELIWLGVNLLGPGVQQEMIVATGRKMDSSSLSFREKLLDTR